MMCAPPAAPVTTNGAPVESSTIVGVMLDSIRLPGAIAFASHCRRPIALTAPTLVVKSSISLFSRKPAPVTVTPEPYPSLSVVVIETALP